MLSDDGAAAELLAAAGELEATRWAALLVDRTWTLRWVSSELRALLRDPTDEELGLGDHFLAAYSSPAWTHHVSEDSYARGVEQLLPYVLHESDDEALEQAGFPPRDQFAELGLASAPAPPAWTGQVEFVTAGLPPAKVTFVTSRLASLDGSVAGTAVVFGSPLRATVNDLLVRGDEAGFERMAELLTPRREPVAVLFVDLQDSTGLARKVSSETFFWLLRSLFTLFDARVTDLGGIVGRHAGDGMSAFFPARTCGGSAGAARSALRLARELPGLIRRLPGELTDMLGALELNAGAHFADDLHLGQVVTAARLEVTALGDGVNETARLEAAAHDGQVLVSGRLLEQLSPDDLRRLGVSAALGGLRRLRDLPDVPAKSRRDVGDLLVVDLAAVWRGSPELRDGTALGGHS